MTRSHIFIDRTRNVEAEVRGGRIRFNDREGNGDSYLMRSAEL